MSTAVYAPGGILISMPAAELAKLCRGLGTTLPLQGTDDGHGKPIDGPTLLWAMSGRESSFGRNMKPRHEPAYDSGGRYSKNNEIVNGLKKWGSAFACSYGPLQIMACNAKGCTPDELAHDPEASLGASVAQLRIVVLGEQHAHTIAEICECWNGGHLGATTTPGYAAEVQAHYAAGLPETGTAVTA